MPATETLTTIQEFQQYVIKVQATINKTREEFDIACTKLLAFALRPNVKAALYSNKEFETYCQKTFPTLIRTALENGKDFLPTLRSLNKVYSLSK